MKVHHIGQLTENIDDAIKEYLLLGYDQISGVIEHKDIFYSFMKNGDTYIELVSPIGEKSNEARFLKTKGAGLYHICYETNNIKREILNFQVQGYAIIDTPYPSKIFENRNISVLYHKNLGLVELIEY